MYQQNYNGGQETPGYQPQNQPQAGKQKKEVINKVELVGYIVPRSANETDRIQFYPFRNGGGAVHCSLKLIQYTGQADENGQPKYRTTYVPLDINANKSIPVTALQGLVPGMKARVVGELRTQTYEKKTTHEKVTSLVVSVYFLEILQMPMQVAPFQSMQQGYNPQQQYQQPPQYQQQYQQPPQYQQQYQQQPQYQPQPQYQQPPQYQQQPQYQQFVDDGDLPRA